MPGSVPRTAADRDRLVIARLLAWSVARKSENRVGFVQQFRAPRAPGRIAARARLPFERRRRLAHRPGPERLLPRPTPAFDDKCRLRRPLAVTSGFARSGPARRCRECR